jgi:hypothetical protein
MYHHRLKEHSIGLNFFFCGGFVHFNHWWMPCKQERKQIEKNIADEDTSTL